MAAKNGMKRLARVYGMMEQMRSLERRIASHAVDDAVCAATIQRAVRESVVTGARDALAAGNREEQRIAETTRKSVEGRIERLAKVCVEREAILTQAVEHHRESRLRMEQMERLLLRVQAEDAVQDGRREQAVADDRFGARLAWLRGVRLCDPE